MSKRNKAKDSDTKSENSLANFLNYSDNDDDDNQSIASSDDNKKVRAKTHKIKLFFLE